MDMQKKLKEARERIGLTLSDVKQQTGIGESSLSDFENGKREPKISQLAQLARVYNRSLSFFLDETSVAAECVLWRERPADGASLLESKFLKWCEQYRNLEEWTGDVITPQLPEVKHESEIRSYAAVEELARKIRLELNLGDRPAFILLKVLEEDCGIKVFHDEFEPTGTAACIKSDPYGWAVLMNSKNTPSRRNYDLAHELFHLLVWNVYRAAQVNDANRDGQTFIASEQEEKYANAFASSLLLPMEALKKSVDRHRSAGDTLPTAVIYDIARQFGVSVEALIWRVYNVYGFGKERKEEITQLITSIRQRGKVFKDLQEETANPSKFPVRYIALASLALRNGEISVGKFMEYTGISRREAMNYLDTEGDAPDEVKLTAA